MLNLCCSWLFVSYSTAGAAGSSYSLENEENSFSFTQLMAATHTQIVPVCISFIWQPSKLKQHDANSSERGGCAGFFSFKSCSLRVRTAARLLEDGWHLCELALLRQGRAENNSAVIGVPGPGESFVSSIIPELPCLICSLALILKVKVQPTPLKYGYQPFLSLLHFFFSCLPAVMCARFSHRSRGR